MDDAELSLAVAKALMPEYEWVFSRGKKVMCANGEHSIFDYTTPEALGQMAVWWATNYRKWHKEPGLVAILAYPTCGNPNRELAQAIVEVSNG